MSSSKIGKRINSWTVLELDVLKSNTKRTFFICECKCGNRLSKRSDELCKNGPKQCKLCDNIDRSLGFSGNICIDISYKKFGKLTAIEVNKKSKNYTWKCQCDCGNIQNVCGGNLKKGNSTQCNSCANKTRGQLLHGFSRRRSMRSEYKAWCHMKERCFSPKAKGFYNYGGRGISIYDEWIDSFEKFYEYIGPKPTPQHSIDRINNDGNYEPGNVRWATKKEQANNRRKRI